MNKSIITVLSCFLLPLASMAGKTQTHVIDGAHSNINFTILHLGLSKVTGSFESFDGRIVYDPENPSNNSATVTVQVASIDTNNAKRDAHLNNEDYFDTPQYPVAEFKSTSWKKTGEKAFEVKGDLTIMEKTRPVTLDVELIGTGEMRGSLKSGWTASTTLDRYDWGIGGEGNLPLGREVEISINVEASVE